MLERYSAREALDAVLDAYLGPSVGQQILRGKIRAGDGELIDAAILIADLHEFTRHAVRLDPAATVKLLNRYFDCLVDPIREHGGHVLKFIGDAVLASSRSCRANLPPILWRPSMPSGGVLRR